MHERQIRHLFLEVSILLGCDAASLRDLRPDVSRQRSALVQKHLGHYGPRTRINFLDENCAPLVYYAAISSNFLPTFRDA